MEKSCLIECLPVNAVILADRGFKEILEIECALVSKNRKLLRPPSVYANRKPSREEVIKSKTIASLPIHVERVIRRIREFKILKPHSVVNHKHVGFLDQIIMIACGLINLQGDLIKINWIFKDMNCFILITIKYVSVIQKVGQIFKNWKHI